MPILTFWDPEAAAMPGTSQIFHGLQDELDQNSTGTFHGAASCQPASLTYSLLGPWANWKSVQRLSSEAGRKILWFIPNQNKRVFLRSETNWTQLPEPSQPVTSEEWLPGLLFFHWRHPGMSFCLLPSNPCSIDYAC